MPENVSIGGKWIPKAKYDSMKKDESKSKPVGKSEIKNEESNIVKKTVKKKSKK